MHAKPMKRQHFPSHTSGINAPNQKQAQKYAPGLSFSLCQYCLGYNFLGQQWSSPHSYMLGDIPLNVSLCNEPDFLAS